MAERVLIVDDEPAITAAATTALARAGYDVASAASAERAIEMAIQEPFDLLVSDIVLPGLSGIDLLRTIKQLYPDLVSIMITGHGSMQLAIEALQAGAKGFLLKPFTANQLREAAEDALSTTRLHRAKRRLQALLPLYDATRLLHSETDPHALGSTVCAQLATTLGAELVLLNLAEPIEGPADPPQLPALCPTAYYPAGEPLTALNPALMQWTISTREPLTVPEPSIATSPSRLRRDARPTFSLYLPLLTPDSVVGLACLQRPAGGAEFDDAELEMATILGSQAALALRNAATMERVRLLAAEAARQAQELRDAQVELTATQEDLMRAQRLETAGRIAAQVAHDFNNLLAPLRGFPELIKDRLPDDHPAREYCDIMIEAAQRMAEINEDLLILAGRGHFAKEPVEIGSLVRQAVAQLDLPATVRLTVEIANDPLTVMGTAGQLLRAVTNLILNARDATGGLGPITLRLTAFATPKPAGFHATVPPGAYALLAISDRGPGVPPEVQEHMFDAFFTTKQTGSSRGTGLGLSIVRSVLADHAGFLDFETASGVGTTFMLYLPLVSGITTRSEGNGLARGHESVLVVEDDPVQRNLVAQCLRELGYTVNTAASGEDALAAAEANPPAVLILDMLLGEGIDGAETYRRLHALNPAARAVLLSGFSESERVQLAQHLGAGPYLRKPVSLHELARVVRSVLDGPAE